MPKVAFDHPSADQQQMLKDRYECLRSSMGFVAGGGAAAALPNEALYTNCMVLKGYARNSESGRLVVPPELVSRTY